VGEKCREGSCCCREESLSHTSESEALAARMLGRKKEKDEEGNPDSRRNQENAREKKGMRVRYISSEFYSGSTGVERDGAGSALR